MFGKIDRACVAGQDDAASGKFARKLIESFKKRKFEECDNSNDNGDLESKRSCEEGSSLHDVNGNGLAGKNYKSMFHHHVVTKQLEITRHKSHKESVKLKETSSEYIK